MQVIEELAQAAVAAIVDSPLLCREAEHRLGRERRDDDDDEWYDAQNKIISEALTLAQSL